MGSKEKHNSKYIIEARFVVDGVVEKHDVIGAIFGQTEGLFPKEFELRELQKSGKIGRIDIQLKSEKDRTEGRIIARCPRDRELLEGLIVFYQACQNLINFFP